MRSLVYHKQDRNDGLVAAVLQAGEGAISATDEPADRIEWLLLEHQADIALTSPLLFGKREGDLVLLPGACLTAGGSTNDVQLYFREGLRSIETLGYYGAPGIDTMLAQIVLKEKYGMKPRLQPVTQLHIDALTTVDALVRTSTEPGYLFPPDAGLDLIDEWFDMTQLPFVREVFLGWEASVDAAAAAAIEQAGELLDDESLRELERAMETSEFSVATSAIPPHYRYKFTDDAHEGLRMFFQLAFFHGLHRDIPDFRIWEEG